MSNKTEYRLTTIDNPYNPFTQLESWFLYDVEKGYNTCGYLARITDTLPDELEDDPDNIIKTNKAIDEIIKNDFRNIYVRVKRTPSEEKQTQA